MRENTNYSITNNDRESDPCKIWLFWTWFLRKKSQKLKI